MNISDEAVEASAQIVYRTSGRKRVMSYAEAREECRAEAIDILSAAAPHLMVDVDVRLVDAYDEGVEAGKGLRPLTNPYRAGAGE